MWNIRYVQVSPGSLRRSQRVWSGWRSSATGQSFRLWRPGFGRRRRNIGSILNGRRRFGQKRCFRSFWGSMSWPGSFGTPAVRSRSVPSPGPFGISMSRWDSFGFWVWAAGPSPARPGMRGRSIIFWNRSRSVFIPGRMPVRSSMRGSGEDLPGEGMPWRPGV